MIRHVCVLSAALAAAACSSSTTGGSTGAPDASTDAPLALDAASDTASPVGACATLPSTAMKQGAGCTGQSGTFTEDTFDTVAGTYDETCSATPYKNQADFDTNEGTSGAAGTMITSNEDYVLTASCASGSISYQTTGSAKTKIVFIWTKVP